MGKYIGDCRLTHYSALLRKALDDAGYAQVPILTNDDEDSHNLHPGFKMNMLTAVRIAFGMPMIDALEELLRKIRPYELEEGMKETARILEEIAPGQSVGIFIGPEGGFEEEEVEQAKRAGAHAVTLGKRILRTETAGLTALSILMYHLEGRAAGASEC